MTVNSLWNARYVFCYDMFFVVCKILIVHKIVVAVAQLVEHLNVAQAAAGSSPVSHPSKFSLSHERERHKALIVTMNQGFF
jgi:hypothetical protein